MEELKESVPPVVEEWVRDAKKNNEMSQVLKKFDCEMR